ncbi:MAG: D-alanyl-D-alanine carboxypeptidase [Magnetospirillum sp.]|nr:D-alanyl-D-alanine carboxypeptidase [Magnetospirillum sp.]
MTPLPIRRSLIAAFVIVPMTLAAAGALAASGETLDTPAKQALILDYNTNTVLFEKNADELMVPSSMSKLMTIYMVFKKLKEGSWTMTDQLPVTETAWKKHYKSGGSLMFLPVHSMATVGDLLRGVIIDSGNDACSVLAEGYAGSEDAFAEEETRTARNDLGMTNSTFRNASGWPDPDHRTTARDLAILTRHLINDFPEYYPIFAERSFVYNNIKQDNRNPLVWTTQGADGLKTGHTEEGGYGLVGSVKRGDRRIIMVINGLDKQKQRWDESQRLIEWAFREFDDYTLFKPGDAVTDADVWLGDAATVPLVAGQKLEVTMPRRARRDMKVTAVYDGPIAAPIRKGDVVGKLVVTAPGVPTAELPLAAGADVAKLGFAGRISAAVKYLLWGPKG